MCVLSVWQTSDHYYCDAAAWVFDLRLAEVGNGNMQAQIQQNCCILKLASNLNKA